jgi:hypothetical protein
VSDTPETDVITLGLHYGPFVEALADHARKLERERDLLRRQVEVLAKFAAQGACVTCFRCPCRVGRDWPCALLDCASCVKNLTQWSLEKAKKGGVGE